MEHIFLTPTEIALLLKISKAQVHRLITREDFPITRYHHRIIVGLEDLLRYLFNRLPINQPSNSAGQVHASSKKSVNKA